MREGDSRVFDRPRDHKVHRFEGAITRWEDCRSLNVHLHRLPHLAHPLANPFTTMARCAGLSSLSRSILAVEEVLRQWAHKIFIQGLQHFNGTRWRIREARAGIKYSRNKSNQKILSNAKYPFALHSVHDPLFRQQHFTIIPRYPS